MMRVIDVEDKSGKADVLFEPCDWVEYIDDGIKTIIKEMLSVMLQQHGAGLAANQVGVKYRIFTMLVKETNSYGGEERIPTVMINPKLTAESGRQKGYEGCLSFGNKRMYLIKRRANVEVTYLDIVGNECKKFLTGFEAAVAQHEMDHLAGITMKQRWEEQGKKGKVKYRE